jgi:hypothetical protein
MSDEMVTITKKEYDGLIRQSTWLMYLEAAGVDNWDGYSYAFELKEEDEKKSEP